MNKSLPLNYEIANESDSLTDEESLRLLSMNKDGNMSEEPTSILNFNNSQFLVDNLDNVKAIQERFKLASETKAKMLIQYYRDCLKAMSLASNSP